MFVLRYLIDLLLWRLLVDGLGSVQEEEKYKMIVIAFVDFKKPPREGLGEGVCESLGEGLGVSFGPRLDNSPFDLSEENRLLEVEDISSSSLLCNSLTTEGGVNVAKIKAWVLFSPFDI